MSATGKVNLADSRVGNQRSRDGGSIGSLVENDVQAAGRKTGLTEDITKSPEALGREFRALEHNCVTRSKREGNCTRAEDVGGVPARLR